MPNIPSNFYIANDPNKLIFEDIFNEKTSFGKITNTKLLFSIFSVTNRKEVPEQLDIAIQEGFHDTKSGKGYSARHIIEREHLALINTHFNNKNTPVQINPNANKAVSKFKPETSSDDKSMSTIKSVKENTDDGYLYQALIKITNISLCNINNLTSNDPNQAMAWCKEKSAFVFAVDTKINFRGLNHLLITLYPSGRDKLLIGTLYLIKPAIFLQITQGNSRYRPIEAPPLNIEKEISTISSHPQHAFNQTHIPEGKKEISQSVISVLEESSYKKLHQALAASDESQSLDLFQKSVAYDELVSAGIFEINILAYAEKPSTYLKKQETFLKKQIEQQQELCQQIALHQAKADEINKEVEKLKTRFNEIKLYFSNRNNESGMLKFSPNEVFERFLLQLNIFYNYKEMLLKTNKFSEHLNNALEVNYLSNDNSNAKLHDLSIQQIENCLEKNILKLNEFINQANGSTSNNKVHNLFRAYKEIKLKKSSAIAKHNDGYYDLIDLIDDTFLLALDCANSFILFALKQDASSHDKCKRFSNQHKEFIAMINNLIQEKAAIKEIAEATSSIKDFNAFEENLRKFSARYQIFFLSEKEYLTTNAKKL